MADNKKTGEVTRPAVAKVMLRVALLPKLRKKIRELYGPGHRGFVSKREIQFLILSTLAASPYKTLLDNYMKAAGYSEAELVNLL